MDDTSGKVLHFVFDLNSGKKENNTFRCSLRAKVKHLPYRSVISVAKNFNNTYLGPNRNFRSTPADLNKHGLAISGAYQRPDGRVVFTTGPVVDVEAELLFISLTKSSGWLTVRHENLDGSVVFSSKDARFLSENIASGTLTKVPRQWSKRKVELFPSQQEAE